MLPFGIIGGPKASLNEIARTKKTIASCHGIERNPLTCANEESTISDPGPCFLSSCIHRKTLLEDWKYQALNNENIFQRAAGHILGCDTWHRLATQDAARDIVWPHRIWHVTTSNRQQIDWWNDVSPTWTVLLSCMKTSLYQWDSDRTSTRQIITPETYCLIVPAQDKFFTREARSLFESEPKITREIRGLLESAQTIHHRRQTQSFAGKKCPRITSCSSTILLSRDSDTILHMQHDGVAGLVEPVQGKAVASKEGKSLSYRTTCCDTICCISKIRSSHKRESFFSFQEILSTRGPSCRQWSCRLTQTQTYLGSFQSINNRLSQVHQGCRPTDCTTEKQHQVSYHASHSLHQECLAACRPRTQTYWLIITQQFQALWFVIDSSWRYVIHSGWRYVFHWSWRYVIHSRWRYVFHFSLEVRDSFKLKACPLIMWPAEDTYFCTDKALSSDRLWKNQAYRLSPNIQRSQKQT